MTINKSPFKLIVVGCAVFFASCNSDSSSTTTTSGDSSKNITANNSGTTSNGGSTSGIQDSSSNNTSGNSGASGKSGASANPNQQAIDYAVTKNTKELMWLQAGEQRGTSKDLKDHAKMMMVDHKNLAAKVTALMGKKGYTKPNFDTTNEVNINNKSGADWDKAWVSKMIVDHTEILSMFGKAKESVTDADLKEIITNTVPVVQKHLDMARMLDKKIK